MIKLERYKKLAWPLRKDDMHKLRMLRGGNAVRFFFLVFFKTPRNLSGAGGVD